MKKRLMSLLLAFLCAACALTARPARAASPSFSQLGVYDFGYVTGTNKLNLRAGPGANYNWLGVADENAWVGITGETEGWYAVYVLNTAQSGYMSKNYIQCADPAPEAAYPVTGVVSQPNPNQFLNLRAYPSYDAQVLGIYYNGTPFSLLADMGGGWYQVSVGGQVGYFRQEYVQLYGAPAASSQISYVQASVLSLYSAPTASNQSQLLWQYPAGTQVSVLLAPPKTGAYWKVSVNGLVGYMDSRYLSPASASSYTPAAPAYPAATAAPAVQPSAAVITPSFPRPATQGTAIVKNPKSTQYLNLRAAPSTTARVIARYKNGVRFEVIAPGETWTKVYGPASGNIGYFMTKYLSLSGVSASPTKRVSNGNSYVNLRSSPSKATGRVYAQVPSGATVTVLIPGDEWTKVRYQGTTGYMMTNFLK